MSLAKYNSKRNFKETSEPEGKLQKEFSMRFVVQRHQASHLHYDFRLELDGVLKSWAVPKGPSLNPSQKRLAVMVEDHPSSYINFKGTIPKGNYGAGTVEIWDNGNFVPVNAKHEPLTEKEAVANLKKGELKFLMKGKKLKGEFVLVKLKNEEKNWLLIKHKDEHAVTSIYNAEDAATTKQQSIGSIKHGRATRHKKFIKPMLATLSKIPFDDENWIYEIKWDGYRAISEVQDGEVKLYSRNGIDFGERFPVIKNALEKLKHSGILDGEIVLLDSKGMPDFEALQNYERHLNQPLIYYVFDLLELNGKKMDTLALIDRKEILEKLLVKNTIVKYCSHVQSEGIAFMAEAKKAGLEGVIAKEKNSSYAFGTRSKQWLKIKNVQSSEAMIVGYTAPSGSRTHFGSLVLASKSGKVFEYRGHVGTGFSDSLLAELSKKMKPLETSEMPFDKMPVLNGAVTWLKPKLVADIAYTEVTSSKSFRHPVFLRLRDDKTTRTVNEEIIEDIREIPKEEIKTVGSDKVKLTNQHKLYWPEQGFTKGDLINYYEEIYRYILPHLKDRPLSLKRNPNGIMDDGFYHKDAGEGAPNYVKVFKDKNGKKVIDYIVCNNKATLLYLANLGCIEMNPWNSTDASPEKPTWMVIDIDPSAKNDFGQVVETALVVKKILDKGKIKSFCKTSGASGLHIYVPLKNKYDYEVVKTFAHIVARLVVSELPAFTTIERSLKKRGDRIYIDYLQNRTGQTLASAYSVRPVPLASVSTPLEWKEVNKKLHPSQFTLKNMGERLKKKGDLFKSVLSLSNNLDRALTLLGQ